MTHETKGIILTARDAGAVDEPAGQEQQTPRPNVEDLAGILGTCERAVAQEVAGQVDQHVDPDPVLLQRLGHPAHGIGAAAIAEQEDLRLGILPTNLPDLLHEGWPIPDLAEVDTVKAQGADIIVQPAEVADIPGVEAVDEEHVDVVAGPGGHRLYPGQHHGPGRVDGVQQAPRRPRGARAGSEPEPATQGEDQSESLPHRWGTSLAMAFRRAAVN